MPNFDWRSMGSVILYSYAFLLLITFLMIQLGLPYIKNTGYGLIILGVVIVLSMLITMGRDWKFEKNEIIMFVIVLVTMVALYYVMKTFIPELFSSLPQQFKSIFSFMN